MKPFRDTIEKAKPNKDGGSFSNMYFKILNGKIYDPISKGTQGMFVGDVKGDPVNGTAWRLQCHKNWVSDQRLYSGPCHFKTSHLGKIHNMPLFQFI